MAVSGAWTYTLSGTDATITDYDTGVGGFSPTIPTTLDGNDVIKIASGAMKSKSLTAVTISHSIDLAGDAIASNGSISVTINANLTTSSVTTFQSPFRLCTIGANLTLGASVTTIPSYIFYNSGVSSVDLTNITNIDTNAFDTNSLSTVTIDHAIALKGECFRNNGSLSVNMTANVTTPSVTEFNPPFELCTLGANLTLGASVTTIPSYLFANCGLTSVDLTYVTDIGIQGFASNSLSTVTIDHAIALKGECFRNNGSLTVSITANVTTPAVTTLNPPFELCTLGANVTIGENVTTIPAHLFTNCGLTEILFPSSMTNIGQNALSSNANLSSITFEAEETITFGSGILTSCTPSPKGDIYGYDASVETWWSASWQTYYNYTMLSSITAGGIPSTTATILICDYQTTESAETGTVENEIDIAGHSYSADDFIVNTTQNNTSRRILSTTTDSIIVTAVSGQTVNDVIRTYKFIDHTDKLKDSTLRVNKKIQEDTEANFTLICPPTYIPRAGQYVKINTNGQHVFTGFLRSVKRRLPQNGIDTKIFCDCECITLNAIPPRRTVAIAYEVDTTVGNIVSSLVDSFLVSDGVVSGTIDDGVVLSEDWYDDTLSIGDILDSVAEQSGFQWMIDKNFNLQFYQDPTTISTYSATISDLTTSTFNEFRNVTINETIDNYNNKAFYTGNTDDYGNIIVVSQETTASILEMQDYSAGSGVYGAVVRDGNFTQHEFFTATAGTTESTISASGIGAEVDVGDMVYNIDGYERRNVLAKSGDVLTVDAVSGQTEGQIIATYQQINNLVDNHLKRQDQIPRRLEFDSFNTDFEAGQKLEVVLSKLSVTTTETYVIDEVDIQDRGANYFVAHVVADKRNADNFSTQRTPNYKDYYRQF